MKKACAIFWAIFDLTYPALAFYTLMNERAWCQGHPWTAALLASTAITCAVRHASHPSQHD